MRISLSPSGRRHCLCFYRDGDGGELFHTDTINIHDDRQRQRLIASLVEHHGIDRAVAEDRMLAVTREVVAEEQRQREDADELGVDRCPYQILDGRFFHCESSSEPSNFTAEIVEELYCDDGVESCRHFMIEGFHCDGTPLPQVRVPASDFEKMDWVTPAWGARAIIAAGRGMRDHVRAAIQEFSRDVPQRTLYRHLGWCKIDDKFVYLHAGGGIGPDGVVPDVDVDLPPSLELFELPEPPTGDACVEAVLASLQLLEIGPDHLTVPLIGTAYRSVLGDTDFSVHLVGASGTFKSTTAALVQQHFGPAMDATHLPGSWSSTANSLEGVLFFAKDATLTIDDFSPTGNSNQIQAAHRDGDRVIRAKGNGSGRGRMRSDGSIRPTKPPRGLVLSTGEDVLRGHSAGARMLVIKVSLGDISLERLSECQRAASNGLFAASMAAFLQWLAPQIEEIQAQLREELPRLRDEMRLEGAHARTPGIAAQLIAGIRCFLRFAVESGSVAQSESEAIERRCRDALRAAVSDQRESQSHAAPERQFLAMIASLLTTCRAHLDPVDHRRPDTLRNYGWHDHPSVHHQIVPGGALIGFVQGDDVYLDPKASFAAAQCLARECGDAIPISQRTLTQRLFESDLLIVETTQSTHLHRLLVRGQRLRLLRLRPGALQIHESDPIETTHTPDGNLGREHQARFPIRAVRPT